LNNPANNKNTISHKILFTSKLILYILLIITCGCGQNNKTDEQTLNEKLDSIRDHKQQQLSEYIDNVSNIAESVKSDSEIKDLFVKKNNLYKKYKGKTIPEHDKQLFLKLRDSIENIYIDKYLSFYDILFVNNTGDIFYTVRRQADYHKNIFTGELVETSLSKQLKLTPNKTFVDFQNYEISGEPSAFFVQPCQHNSSSKLEGWFVFQLSINKINDMFSIEKDLGITGEVILVNKDSYMLTDSRFLADSSILRTHLSEKNISQKLKERIGHKTVIDYLGHKALTSFKVVSIIGTEWLLIAKIDEDEVLTETYKKNRDQNRRQLLQRAAYDSKDYQDTQISFKGDIEVDMDEFRRVSHGETLNTHGVSTCTAVLISCPGRFAYLAHVSPNDSIYGGSQTDLVLKMLKRIENFDIVTNDKRKLEITIVTPNIEHTAGLIDLFVDRGIFLSQIKLLHNSEARYANITHDYNGKGKTIVEWRLKGISGKLQTIDVSKTRNLGKLMRLISQKTI